MNRVSEINENEYFSNDENITLLNINKQWLINELNNRNELKDILIHLANKVMNDDNFFVKQRIISLLNLLNSIRKFYKDNSNILDKDTKDIYELNEQDIYKLNLVIKNFKAFRESGLYIKNEDKTIAINTLITIVFHKGYRDILRIVLNTNKQENIK